MGILDLLFPDPSKKINKNDFREALRRIPALSSKERKYVEESFGGDLNGGLSKLELKNRCQNLRHKQGDVLEPFEVEEIKEKLGGYFD